MSRGGQWCLVLHAHLPFVRHPEHERPLEEDWLFEALTESYLPLLGVLDGLARDGVSCRVALSVSPPLVAMLGDPLLRSRYRRHLDGLVALAEAEVERTAREAPQLASLARHYRERFRRMRHAFEEEHAGDVVAALGAHAAAGRVELLTTAATHGFLPLLERPEAVSAQVRVGVEAHRRAFGRAPAGFWLPECAYQPGHDAILKAAGLAFTFVEAHGLLHAHPRPRHGADAPVVSPAGVAFLARDRATAEQVWSGEVGYPGDPEYREFHRDVGWELPLQSLTQTVGEGLRRPVGIKYHRVSGPGVALGDKAVYDRARALERTRSHAEHFVDALRRHARELAGGGKPAPVVVSPYDAELFGHWWYEGPEFLDAVLRRLAEQNEVEAVFPSEALAGAGELDVVQPSQSTWGADGYSRVWLDPDNDWIYPRLDAAAARMIALARASRRPAPVVRRALDQAARELLLAQSSDWAFLMHAGAAAQYARRRVGGHLERFEWLADVVAAGDIDERRLAAIEAEDALFPWLDHRVYR